MKSPTKEELTAIINKAWESVESSKVGVIITRTQDNNQVVINNGAFGVFQNVLCTLLHHEQPKENWQGSGD